MNVASFFSGVGGFDLGFERQGFNVTIQCEYDPQCRDLLHEKSPQSISVENVLSIPAIHQKAKLGKAPPPNQAQWEKVWTALRSASVFVGGFPCQDVSVAGARAGLAGERSGLWFTFRRVIALFRPPVVVIENVPGLLSSHGGRDFAIILSGLERIGYGVAWRTLDSQYFGLAQRRERLFIVASLGTLRAAEILFERDSLQGDSAPSREAGEGTTGTLSARTQGGGGLGTDFDIGGGLSHNTKSPRHAPETHTETMNPGRAFSYQQPATASTDGGGVGRIDGESETFIPILESGARHGTGNSSRDGLGTGKQHAIAFQPRFFTRDNKTGGAPDVISPPVCASESRSRGDAVTAVAYRTASNCGSFEQGDKTGALNTATDPSQHVIAFTERTRKDGRNFECQEDMAYALTNPGEGGRTQERRVAGEWGVRRLTPRTCERLQGFQWRCQPDYPGAWQDELGRWWSPDYTKGSDSARYRQMGNAVSVPVAEWISSRIRAVTETTP